jgi:hypothetical protein
MENKWKIVVQDSLNHYGPGSSLKKLVEIQGASVKDFPVTSEFHLSKGRSASFIERHFLKKLLLPHEWYNNVELHDSREMGPWPGYEAFHDVLIDEAIKDEVPEHLREATALIKYHESYSLFKEAGCTTFGEYMGLYAENDVLLLCDVFEKKRKISRDTFEGLDPASLLHGNSLICVGLHAFEDWGTFDAI